MKGPRGEHRSARLQKPASLARDRPGGEGDSADGATFRLLQQKKTSQREMATGLLRVAEISEQARKRQAGVPRRGRAGTAARRQL